MPDEGSTIRLLLFLAPIGFALGGCSDDAGGDGPSDGEPTMDAGPTTGEDAGASEAPFQELYDQGFDRYVGMYEPTGTEELAGDVVVHSFDGDDGPVCFTGSPYSLSTRDGASDELMVFLQGGGACGPSACEAIESWPRGIPGPLARMGILNRTDATNPARDHDLAYLPYCDGSIWSGDADVDDDGDGTIDYRFRGLLNLTASIDVIARTYPSPRKILLVGNSAGGFGVHYALPLLRIHYPRVPIEMVNDSGVGISVPGGWTAANEFWGAEAAYPESCADCIGEDGNLTGYHRYQLDQDPELRMGMMSTKRDSVILEGVPMEPSEWEAELLAAVAELETTHPDRFRSFVADGDDHTFLLRNFDGTAGETTAREWIGDLLSDGPWVSVSD